MKHTLALMLTGGTLALSAALPPAMAAAVPDAVTADAAPALPQPLAQPAEPAGASPILLAENDQDDDGWLWLAGDISEDDGSGDDDSSAEACDPTTEASACAVSGNAAPAGTVAPPQNGLFTNGTAPTAISN